MPLENIPFTETNSIDERRVKALEDQAVEMKRQADFTQQIAQAANTQALAYAAMAGTSGGEEYARFERILLAVISSPRNFGTADDNAEGLVNVARALAGYAAAEEARLVPPVTP